MRLSGAVFAGNADTFRFGKTFTMTKKGGIKNIQSARSAITTTELGAHVTGDIMKLRQLVRGAVAKDQLR